MPSFDSIAARAFLQVWWGGIAALVKIAQFGGGYPYPLIFEENRKVWGTFQPVDRRFKSRNLGPFEIGFPFGHFYVTVQASIQDVHRVKILSEAIGNDHEPFLLRGGYGPGLAKCQPIGEFHIYF